jgi:hypothetical protein
MDRPGAWEVDMSGGDVRAFTGRSERTHQNRSGSTNQIATAPTPGAAFVASSKTRHSSVPSGQSARLPGASQHRSPRPSQIATRHSTLSPEEWAIRYFSTREHSADSVRDILNCGSGGITALQTGQTAVNAAPVRRPLDGHRWHRIASWQLFRPSGRERRPKASPGVHRRQGS